MKDVCFDQAFDASFRCTRYQSSNSGRTVPPFLKAVYAMRLFIYLFAQDHHYNNTTYCNAINIILSGKSQKPF